MIRVVLDTNIVISALLQPQGLPARTFLIALARTTAQLCVSGDVYAEYEEVIRRPKFNRSEAIIDHALRAIRENGFWVKPSEKVRACSDPDDDIFLECAQTARAHIPRHRQREGFSCQMGRHTDCDCSPIPRRRG
jgi:putative PIN family toxin of toxin-antitoxin system